MVSLLISFLIASTSAAVLAADDVPVCKPLCAEKEICRNSFTDKGPECVPMPEHAPLKDLVLPFDNGTEVFCTHTSGVGSHSGENAYFALDLATAYAEKPAVVRAAAAGIAYVFLGEDGKLCPAPKGSPAKAESSKCGLSWGNRVKVLHADGFASYYTHLESVLVKNGSAVKSGEPLGIEGWTGAAGHRHLHWSVQKIPGRNLNEWQKNIAYTGASVPFVFKAVDEKGQVRSFDSSTLRCAHASVGAAPPGQQPKFRGLH